MLGNRNIGFIGGGNMAEAIIKGLLAGGMRPDAIMASEPLEPRRQFLASHYGIKVSDKALDVTSKADVIILAIKPQMAASVLTDLESLIPPDTLIISIMAGISTGFIEETLSSGVRVVRVMPNTAALVQAAATAICPGRKADDTDLATATEVFSLLGAVVTTTEKLMDAVTGLSGSGPAYVFAFIEALSDAGVKNGLARDVSLKLAVQTVLGAARMIAETGQHPSLLKEMVTSPGGTTIAGLHVLENGRFHGLVMDAVDCASARSRELSGK